MYRLEPFESKDEQILMELFISNMPDYFDPTEKPEFEKFLKDVKGKYWTCREENDYVGAGGYCEVEKGEARICWLMVQRQEHAKGVGRFMMERFKKLIEEEAYFNRITLKTTQHTDKFYEKLGYTTTRFEKDFWVKGLDLYFMELQLTE